MKLHEKRPRTSVKGKILADFIVKRPKDDFSDIPLEAEEELPDPWTLFTDGSSCVDGSRAGLILMDVEGSEFTYALRFRFEATNKETDYEALIAGLKIAEQMGVKNLQVNVDSRLMANQVNGSYIAKAPVMVLYIEKVKTLSYGFNKFSIKQVLLKELSEKSINVAEVLTVVDEEGDTWMTPIYKYLRKKHSLRKRKSKGNTDKILLAYDAPRCKKTDPRMPGLPGSLPRAKKPATKTDSHYVPVAILQMGN
uniref:Reverse transcriptase domain-containing protein n=1 Tax=Tanacetum cinerariifolium TaxID=118510 RepID=A0A6L2K584_TANCI|nr:reverse transcriptase domain-containing protein [Tanacetum cinerariifolium]